MKVSCFFFSNLNKKNIYFKHALYLINKLCIHALYVKKYFLKMHFVHELYIYIAYGGIL